jgi:molecular chaperone DnaK (HSP70)
MSKRISLGIDLGTTNSAMAVTDLESDRTEVMEITQIIRPNQVGEKPVLPSAVYIPHRDEFPANSFPLPWAETGGETTLIGHFAREHGALIPDRLIISAKSWLSNPHIEARRSLLPWGSDIGDEKLSPFECSRQYLAHLKNAFLYAGHMNGRNWDLSESEVVLTVPASFDAVAQSLTAEAAEAAGLGKVTLLEEPQAAFYAWIAFESFRRFDWGAPELAEMPSLFLRAARVVGDRRFDLRKGLRHQIAAKLENLGIAPQKTGKLKEFIPVGRSERISLHEESLPPGLILVDS